MKLLYLLPLVLISFVGARPQQDSVEITDPAALEQELQAQLDARDEAINSSEIGAEALTSCSNDSQCPDGSICYNLGFSKKCLPGCRANRKCLPGNWCFMLGSLPGLCKDGCKNDNDCDQDQQCVNKQHTLLGHIGTCKYECEEDTDCTGGEFCNVTGGHKCELECDLTSKPCDAGSYCNVPTDGPNKCMPGCLDNANCPASEVCELTLGAAAGTCKAHECEVDANCTDATKYCDTTGTIHKCKVGCRKSPNNCLEFAGGVCKDTHVCAYPRCSPAYDRCATGFYCHSTAKKCKAGCKAKNSLCKTSDNKKGKCNAQHVCVAIVKKKGDACKTTITNDCGTGLKCIGLRKGYSKGVCHPVVGAGKTCNRGSLYAVCSTGLKCKYNKCKA